MTRLCLSVLSCFSYLESLSDVQYVLCCSLQVITAHNLHKEEKSMKETVNDSARKLLDAVALEDEIKFKEKGAFIMKTKAADCKVRIFEHE